MWAFHTNAFIAQRQLALHLWLQGTVRLWQSVSPLRAEEAYAIGEILEAFLCEPDSEAFARTLDELQHEFHESTLSPIASAMSHDSTSTFAQLARAKKRESGNVRRSSSSTRLSAASMDKAKVSASASDLSALDRQATIEKLPAPLPSQLAWVKAPSVGAIGVAIDLRAALPSSPEAVDPAAKRDQYTTYDVDGRRVNHAFRPFTATVVYGEGPEGREAAAQSSGMINACTPVSVPPTPHGQTEFHASWSQYTSSVLEFVAERLDIVTRGQRENNERAFNILDRHVGSTGPDQQQDDDDDEADALRPYGNVVTGGAPLYVVNLRASGSAHVPLVGGDVEDADAGAGGSAGTAAENPLKQARFHAYVAAGEHLVNTILMENEASLDVVGSSDWMLVGNTKDVIVMRRNRPIRRKYLLRDQPRPLGDVLPSPSPPTTGHKSMQHESPGRLRAAGQTEAARDQQHCFMGRGIINAPAQEIFDLVRKPENRHMYDAMLNEEIVLENLLVGHREELDRARPAVGNLLVYYHLFETNRCFLRYTRDFCVMQYAKRVTSRKLTKYVVVGASVEHSDCPQREDVDRATLDLFGWVIEPLSPDKSKVTYLLHIDFGESGVPTHLLNTISFRQPLCVHYLRRYIEKLKAEREERATELAAKA